MKLMVIGGGGREHAIVKSLKKNPDVEVIYCLPGNAGIAADAICVDIGAKAEIYRLINQMVQEGKTVIMISSEMPEILGMCDRIMVLHEGHKMGELMAAEATQEKIMAMCV